MRWSGNLSDITRISPPLRILLLSCWSSALLAPFTGIAKALWFAGGIAVCAAILSILKHTGSPVRLSMPFSAEALSRREIPLSVAALVAAAALPLGIGNYALDVLILCGIYIILAIGLNVIVGFTGLLCLGFAAFYAIGAYSFALLNTKLALGFWVCLPAAALIAAFAGLLVAIPSLRLKGDYLAIVTLGFGEIVRLVLNNWDSVTHGPNGIGGIERPALFSMTLDSLQSYYYVVLVVVVFGILIMRRIKYSGIGRAWMAIRENELAAASSGIDVTRYKTYAFVFGTFWAGIAGILYAAKMQFVSPESFTFMESVLILSMIILGGLGSVYGAVIGACILVILPELLRDLQMYRMLILGIGLVLLMVFRPQGIISGERNASAGR